MSNKSIKWEAYIDLDDIFAFEINHQQDPETVMEFVKSLLLSMDDPDSLKEIMEWAVAELRAVHSTFEIRSMFERALTGK